MDINNISGRNKFIMSLFSYIVSFVFIFSAMTKIADFRNTIDFFLSILGIDYIITQYIIILFILFELGLAFMIAIRTFHTQFFLNSTIILLIFFILISIGFIYRGIDNCGCFGTLLPVRPIPTIFKNLVLIAMLMFLKNWERKNCYAA